MSEEIINHIEKALQAAEEKTNLFDKISALEDVSKMIQQKLDCHALEIKGKANETMIWSSFGGLAATSLLAGLALIADISFLGGIPALSLCVAMLGSFTALHAAEENAKKTTARLQKADTVFTNELLSYQNKITQIETQIINENAVEMEQDLHLQKIMNGSAALRSAFANALAQEERAYTPKAAPLQAPTI